MIEQKSVEVTSRGRVRSWLREVISDSDSVQLPELASEAVEHFRSDQVFIDQLLKESLAPMVYELAHDVMKETRQGTVVLGERVVSGKEFKRRSSALQARFLRWMEHSDGDGHVRLMKMRKKQLLAAAEERTKRGNTELMIAAFEKRVAAGLENDKQAVEEKYSAEDLEEIWKQIEDKGSSNGRV